MTTETLTQNQIVKIKSIMLVELEAKVIKSLDNAKFFHTVADEECRSRASRKDLHEHAAKLEARASAFNTLMVDIHLGLLDDLLKGV